MYIIRVYVQEHWNGQSVRGLPLPLHTAQLVPAGGQLEVQVDNPRGNRGDQEAKGIWSYSLKIRMTTGSGAE